MNIELQKVDFTYPGTTQPALTDLSFQIDSGEIVIIAGPNGAGKSTLLRLINGILKPTVGNVFIDGKNSQYTSTAELAAAVSVTFQNPADQIFAPTVRKEIAFGPQNLRRENIVTIVDSTLALFQMQAMAEQHPYDMLPAQRKLLTIASAVAMDTPILAFDEPSAGLSQRERTVLTHVISNLRSQKRTLLIVTHDLEYFLSLATKAIILTSGKKIFEGTSPGLLSKESELRRFGMRFSLCARLKHSLSL